MCDSTVHASFVSVLSFRPDCQSFRVLEKNLTDVVQSSQPGITLETSLLYCNSSLKDRRPELQECYFRKSDSEFQEVPGMSRF